MVWTLPGSSLAVPYRSTYMHSMLAVLLLKLKTVVLKSHNDALRIPELNLENAGKGFPSVVSSH